MIAKLGVALALAVLTLLTYFQFPGHTYLTQDSQIYVPILEHLWDPSALPREILVERPHVAFTIYDEAALALRWLTHAGFHPILAVQQIVFRALGLWGVYLIALAVLANRSLSLFVTAIFALGAEVAGPAVLVLEYEPTPRAFAIPVVFLAVGLIAHRRDTWAGIALGVAFLFHPPSIYPLLLLLLIRPRVRRLVPVLAAVIIMLAAAHWQTGIKESQQFFSRIAPDLEALQRMRAPYNWVSIWWQAQFWQYIYLSAVAGFAIWRARISGELRLLLAGLPLIGLLSVPVSYILLERLKWSLMPQLQPTRALLFVVAVAVISAAIAACRAAHWWEKLGWFILAYLPFMHANPNVAVLLGLALLATAALAYRPLIPIAALAALRNAPHLSDSRYARSARPQRLGRVGNAARHRLRLPRPAQESRSRRLPLRSATSHLCGLERRRPGQLPQRLRPRMVDALSGRHQTAILRSRPPALREPRHRLRRRLAPARPARCLP